MPSVILHTFPYNDPHIIQGRPDMDISSNQHLWLLGQKSIQNSLLLGALQQKLDFDSRVITPNSQTDDARILPNHIICIDATGLKYERCTQVLEDLPEKNPVIFINLESNSQHEQLLLWPNVCGFFYKEQNHQDICNGIASILKGELWFSRKLLSRFMSASRKAPTGSSKCISSLTKREKQILHLSSSGAKNAEIAKALNVSTHTVKTHMYNLFKKINVSNRIQAINWAKQHLPEHELAI